MLFKTFKRWSFKLLFSYLFFSYCLIATGEALTIDSLTSDNNGNNPSAIQTNSIDIKNALYNGQISKILIYYKSSKKIKTSSDFAYSAIAMLATNQLEQGKKDLTEAVKGHAPQDLTLCAKAILMRKEQKYKEAEHNILQALKISPGHSYYLNVLGRIYFDTQKYPKAINTFKLATEKNSRFLPAYLNLGATYLQTNQNRLALSAFDQALSEEPKESKAFLGKIYAYKATFQLEKAVAVCDLYIEKIGTNAKILNIKADLFYRLGNFNKVLTVGADLENLDSTVSDYWQGLALLHLNKTDASLQKIENLPEATPEKTCLLGLFKLTERNYQSAARSMSSCLAQDNRNITALLGKMTLNVILNDSDHNEEDKTVIRPEISNYFKALYSLKNSNLKNADKYFLLAENMIPTFSMAGIDYKQLPLLIDLKTIDETAIGTFLYIMNFKAKSQLVFNEILKKKSEALLANYWLGQIAWEQGDLENSEKFMKQCINSVKFFPAFYSLAEQRIQKGDVNRAIEFYAKALKIKSDAGILIKLGLLYEKLDKRTDVEKIYTQLIKDFSDLYIGYNQYAWYLTKNNLELEEAWQYATKANELQPNNASILDTLGWLSFKNKNFKQAETYLTKAYNINPATPSVLFHLGALQKQLSNHEAARTLAEKALELNPNFDEAGLARKMLEGL